MSIEDLKSKFNSGRWKQFLANFFGDNYMMWHDGYDPDAILRLPAEEKQVAEDLLIKSIPLNGMWSAAGLALLQSQKGVPIMEEQLRQANATVIRIRLADALLQITKKEEYLYILIDCLQNAISWGDRAEAARELRKYNTPAVQQALFAAATDSDYLVRYHACDSLIVLNRLPGEINEYPEIFQNIVENTTPEMHVIAQEQLRTLFTTSYALKSENGE